jgi:hypothetical protein
MRRRFVLSTLDLVLVSALLAGYGSVEWAWLAGPVSALAIWCVDCSKRPGPTRRPSTSTSFRTHRGSAPTELGSSASRG